MLYAAYGSNLNKTQMGIRCPHAVPVGASALDGWRLIFRRGYLTIEPCGSGEVPLGIWRISGRDERSLDRYEGYPGFYRKSIVTVDVCGKPAECLVYIMRNGFPAKLPDGYYMEICEHGYSDFRLPVLKLHEAVCHTKEVIEGEEM